jgi:L-histidine Nalpha-methyltransferase
LDSRFGFRRLRPTVVASFCQAVAAGLARSPKSVPSRFFYDSAGSVLFEKITHLPEYYLTRAEQSILETHAPEIVSFAPRIEILEFGSGSSRKTRLLLEAALRRQPRLRYIPVDISGDFLRQTAERLLGDYPGLDVLALEGEYFDALDQLPAPERPRLALFLGSNIGNFQRCESVRFLGGLAEGLRAADRALVGLDLVKDRVILERAYDDSQGVTAQFNKNVLRRLNEELGADFDLDAFEHRAPYLAAEGKIEMRLVSMRDQSVWIRDLEMKVPFRKGEWIHTENSHKYTHEGFSSLCLEAGLEVERTWSDERDWFAVKLLRRAG